MTVYNSRVSYVGDGSTTTFAIPFGYLSQTHLTVYVSGALTTAWTLTTSSELTLTRPPASTAPVLIQRVTPQGSIENTIQNGTILPADINNDDIQLLYIDQEQQDELTDLQATSGSAAEAAASAAASEAAAVQAQFALTQIQAFALPHGNYRNFFDIIANNTIISQIQAGTYSGTLDSYWASAMAASRGWFFPEGVFPFANQLTMREGMEIRGETREGTVLGVSVSSGVFAMNLHNANGTGQLEGPKIRNMTIITLGSGIRLNLASADGGGFTNDATSQAYMMRAVLEDVSLSMNGTSSPTNTGIQWNKCFDSHIEHCRITSFGHGIQFEGTDLSSIKENRIELSTVGAIKLLSNGTFGSSTMVWHNDLLQSGADGALQSSDRDLKFIDNYVEDTAAQASMVRILTGSLSARIIGNRMENPSATNLVLVNSDTLYRLNYSDNGTTGTPNQVIAYDDLAFGISSESYYTNSTGRRWIMLGGNVADPSTAPWNNVYDAAPLSADGAFLWTPSRGGLSASNYGATCRANEGGFILPGIASFGSIVNFVPYSFDNSGPLIGVIEVSIIASSDVAGTVLNWQWQDGGTAETGSTVTLTTTPARYVLGTFTAAVGLTMSFWNADLTHGKAFLKRAQGRYTS